MMISARSRRGFTLIELMLATALAVMLLTAALAVFAGIARDRERLGWSTTRPSRSEDMTTWTDVLRCDLSSATDWQFQQTTLTLSCYHALDPSSQETVDRPCQIKYHLIHNSPSSAWLVRDQRYLDQPGTPTTKNLIAVGLQRFELRPLSDDNDANGIVGPLPPLVTPVVTPGKPAQLALPRRVALTLAFDDAKNGVEIILCLR